MSADYPRDEPGDEPLDWPAYAGQGSWHLIGVAALAAALTGVLLYFALYG